MRSELNANSTEPGAAGQYLSADDIGVMITLLSELRELTQSRAAFAKTNELLVRLDPKNRDVLPELVPFE